MIIIGVPKEVKEKIDPLRKKYDPDTFKTQPAHLTIIKPFSIKKDDFGRLVKVLDDFEFKRFKIKLNGLGCFGPKPKNNVIFTKPIITAELRNLNKKLEGSLVSLVEVKDKYKFDPHLTIARRLERKDFERILAELKNFTMICEFRVDYIYLLEWKKDRWEEVKKIEFRI